MQYSEMVRRAALPQILFVHDIGLALQISPSGARRAILRGECGPYLRVGRRLAVLRESFLTTLAKRSVATLQPRPLDRP